MRGIESSTCPFCFTAGKGHDLIISSPLGFLFECQACGRKFWLDK